MKYVASRPFTNLTGVGFKRIYAKSTTARKIYLHSVILKFSMAGYLLAGVLRPYVSWSKKFRKFQHGK